jgi:ABC-2 type transport system permease protein
LWGALLATVGLVFAAIAAVFSQLSPSSKGAVAYSLFTMGAFYMIRAVGDIGVEVLSLISPLGLILRSEAYVGNYWWPVFVLLGITVPIMLLAYKLNLTRDIDQGLLPDKQGKAEGGILLKTPFGLALRLTRTGLIVGFITIFAIAASYGTIMGDIEGFIEANEFSRNLMWWEDGIPLPILFAGTINFIAAIMSLVPIIIYVHKARSEEKEIRGELVLATPVCRFKYLGSYVFIGFLSSIILQFLAGLGLWMTSVSVLDDPGEFPFGTIMLANIIYLPAIWVIIGLIVLLIGLFPKATGLIWAVFGAAFFMGMFGRLIFPEWAQNFSPFGYVAQYPMESISWPNLIVLTGIAVVLTSIGLIGFRRRDVGVV